jgi:sulfite reductase alpha subunit-like flavoprotein
VTAWELFEKHLDILGSPRRYFFEMLAHFTENETQKEKLREFASTEYQHEFHK